jgi:hypothetical protein
MSMQQRGERHIERMAGVSERGVDHIEIHPVMALQVHQ